MSVVDVVELSGVGPVIAARLDELGVSTTSDLLRANRRRLADLLDGVSVAQVGRWQAVAELLEVAGVELAVAEALYGRGVESVDELGVQPLSVLGAHADALVADNALPVRPSDDELVAWIVDAVRLGATGVLNGTVVDAAGTPIVGVSVACMGQEAQTDVRGRFRLRRLPLGRELGVFLDHPEFEPATLPVREVASPGAVRGDQFRLSRRRSGASPRVLSELTGDQLPSRSSAPARLRVQDGAPADDDVLRVVEVLDAGGVRAVSRLLDYDRGVFVVRSYRLDAANVAPGVDAGQHLRRVNGRWAAVAMTERDLDHHRRRLRERRLYPLLPAQPTASDIDRALRDWNAARRASQSSNAQGAPPHG